MEQCVPSEAIYGSTIIQGDSPLLQEAVTVFKNNVELEFEAIVCNNHCGPENVTVGLWNIKRFKEYMLNGNFTLSAIEQDEYSSAFLPSWTAPIYDADFSDKRNVAIFLRYSELFDEGKILFGVQTKNIASIELVLT